jgi:hypothetical protein
LVDFPSVVHAVQCAQHIQAQLRMHNAERARKWRSRARPRPQSEHCVDLCRIG